MVFKALDKYRYEIIFRYGIERCLRPKYPIFNYFDIKEKHGYGV